MSISSHLLWRKRFSILKRRRDSSARAVLNFMFWLIAMPFRENGRSREASAFLNPNIWYEPSDLSIAFQAFIVPFHNVAFQRWSYDPASSIYFTISLGRCFSTWLWLTFRPSSRSRLKLLNFTADALPTNEIIYHETLPMLFFSSRGDGNELATKENQQVSHWNGGNKMICN